MSMIQLIYSSRPVAYSPESIDTILTNARKNNRSEGITGSLIHRKDLFVQLLEGPRSAVSNIFARILQDKRHTEVAVLHAGDAQGRLFAKWDMRGDTPPDWMWSMADVRAGVISAVTAAEAVSVFNKLAHEV